MNDINFVYATTKAKLGSAKSDFVSWGTAFVDMDLDGDEDLLVANGHIEKRSMGVNYEQPPLVFENDRGKRFIPGNGMGTFLASKHAARSLALGDFNHDGLIDFVVGRLNADLALVENRSSAIGGYCVIKCIGIHSNRNGIGATIRLRTKNRVFVRHLYGGGSYASSWEPFAHFGLPAADEFDGAKLEIDWPSGIEQRFHLTGLNVTIVAIETEGDMPSVRRD